MAELAVLRDNTKNLLRSCLFASAEIVGSVLLSRAAVAPSNPPYEEMHAEALELYADALTGKGENLRALAYVKQAITERKLGPRRLRSRSGTPRHSPDNSGQSIELRRQSDGGASSSGPVAFAVGNAPGDGADAAADAGNAQAQPGSSGSWQRGYMHDASLRFKEARCFIKSGEQSKAITALEGVLLFARTAEMNICLAQVYENVGLKRNAATAYKQGLRQRSLALEVVPPLLVLSGGADRAEIWDIISNGLASLPGAPTPDDLPWLEYFVEGHACNAANNYRDALQNFVDMERWCPNNVHALLHMGKAYADLDMWEEALQAFAKARLADERCVDMMDWYAMAAAVATTALTSLSFEATSALHRLTTDLLRLDCKRPEPWVAAALLCQQRQELEAGLTLLDKALEMRPRYPLALYVRGDLLMGLERPEHAQVAYRQANVLSRDIHSYSGLVASAIACRRTAEAVSIAREAVTAMPDSASAATILGKALLRSAESTRGDLAEAKLAFKRALLLDPKCMDAALLLADCHVAAAEYGECIEMLLSMTWSTPSDAAHRKLAEVYHRNGQLGEALTFYHMAISLNPNNADAALGLENLEKQMRGIDPAASSALNTSDEMAGGGAGAGNSRSSGY